jgi:hypothetical protein
MLFAEFEHAPDGIGSNLTFGGVRRRDSNLLNKRKDVFVQLHATSTRSRKEAGFDLGPEMKCDGHDFP